MSPFASFVVLNHNGDEVLRRCLDALAGQTDPDFELVLVDNASSVPWKPLIPQSLRGRLTLVENQANEGFARGNNLGAARARGEWLVLVNNDATLAPDFLAELKAAAGRFPDCRVFAAQACIEDFPGFIDSAGVGLFLDGVARNRGWQEPKADFSRACEVMGMVGAVAAIRKDAWAEVGPFDEEFFLYLEDYDWDLRAVWKGVMARYEPRLKALHKHSSTTGKHTILKAYYVERNHVWVALKTFPWPLLLLAPCYTVYRYGLQAYAAAARRGITSSFMRTYSRAELFRVLYRAYRDALLGLPLMWRRRREVMAGRRLSAWRFLRLVARHRLSWRDFAFKD